MVWNSGKRLSGTPIFQVDQLVALFDENIIVESTPESDHITYRRSSSDDDPSTSKPKPSAHF